MYQYSPQVFQSYQQLPDKSAHKNPLLYPLSGNSLAGPRSAPRHQTKPREYLEIKRNEYNRLPPIQNRVPVYQETLQPSRGIHRSHYPETMAELARERALQLRNYHIQNGTYPQLQAERSHNQRMLRQIFDERRVKEFQPSPLASNLARNPDLNDYERASLGLEALNADQIKNMRKVPVGGDLYRFKVEQAREVGTVRSEVMKMLEERKMKDIKVRQDIGHNLEDKRFENGTWSDDQSKNIIQAFIRKNVTKEQNLE